MEPGTRSMINYSQFKTCSFWADFKKWLLPFILSKFVLTLSEYFFRGFCELINFWKTYFYPFWKRNSSDYRLVFPHVERLCLKIYSQASMRVSFQQFNYYRYFYIWSVGESCSGHFITTLFLVLGDVIPRLDTV